MGRFSQRENILLPLPQRALVSHTSSPKTPSRHADVDFHDVFGGPPRRASMRYSLVEAGNPSSSTSIRGEEDTDLPRSRWSGPSERPVFGEDTVNRRRYPSDDFFDDIFGGDDTLSSPRMADRDPFGSSPGSRVMSPARSLLPRADPYGSSLPAQFQLSLPAEISKAIQFPAYASGNHSPRKVKDPNASGTSHLHTPSSPLSRLSSETFQEQDELRNEIQLSYRPSRLSRQFSLSSKEPSHVTKSDELESTEAPTNSIPFHFSIYKWASKGVPLSMPLRDRNSSKSKEKGKTLRCSSTNGRVESETMTSGLPTAVYCDSDLQFLNHEITANNEANTVECSKQDESSLPETSTEDGFQPSHIIEEAVVFVQGPRSNNNIPRIVETVPDDNVLSDKGEVKPPSLSEKKLSERTEKGLVPTVEEAQKPEVKPLLSFLSDTNKGQGNDSLNRKSEVKHRKMKKTMASHSNGNGSKNLKKHDDRRINSNTLEAVQASDSQLQGSCKKSGENLGRDRVKGKVKEFVKIFGHKATSKAKNDVKSPSQSSQLEVSSTYGEDDKGSAETTQCSGIDRIQNRNNMKTPPNACVRVEKKYLEPEKHQSPLRTTVFAESDNSIGQKDASQSSSESLPRGSKVAVGNIDDVFLDNFVIKELSNGQEKVPQLGNDYEDIQISDAKIRQWKNGKEGNIRSLLSTLQLVLWPGSGWKPVPLVDIIEGSAVKRAYQKAMLCLHPDKLQQKGAASHQKYVAEKVFDILQEAWDHFNSLGAI